MSDAHSVTQLLEQWNHGDREALDKLMPLIYVELRKMAKRYMSQQNPGHTLQTTALIHEAYLRMVKQKEKHFENRAHFFGVAAQAMRHILVDYARARQTSRRGGGARPISLEEAALVTQERAAELVAFDDALKELEKLFKATEPGSGIALFWWIKRGGDGYGPGSLTGHSDARLEHGQDLVTSRSQSSR